MFVKSRKNWENVFRNIKGTEGQTKNLLKTLIMKKQIHNKVKKEGNKERRKEGKKERRKEGKKERRKEGKKKRRKEGKNGKREIDRDRQNASGDVNLPQLNLFSLLV